MKARTVAMIRGTENGKPFIYAESAILCNAQQLLTAHS